MHNPRWCLFFDFHTMPACPDVGEKFKVDEFTDRIKRCGVDYIVFPAKCNLGMCYYDTKIGNRHPSLKYDMFGKLVDACKKKDIAISAYINVGISHQDALNHREWCIITPEGYLYKPDRLNSFFRMMCYNTEYKNYILEIVKEVVSNYPVDGLFLDCMKTPPCTGVECIKEMKEKGIAWETPEGLEEFALFSRVRMAKRISETAKKINPELLLFFNGISYHLQKNIGNYIEYECLPTGGWGYDVLPVFSRYLRNMGKPVINMTGRFHKGWGDFGGIRTVSAIEYDCIYGFANTMRVTIGDHLHPSGKINEAVFNTVEKIYKKMQKFETFFEGAKPLVEAAVIVPGIEDRTESLIVAKGTARMLSELKIQFDILTEIPENKNYKLIVLPDNVFLDENSEKRLKNFLDNGGKVISSGYSGINKEKNNFALEEFGLKFEGEIDFDPSFIIPEKDVSENLPDMPLNFYEKGIKAKPERKTEILAKIVAPYYSKHWDGEHGFVYLPPDKITDWPAATINNNLIHISHFVFKAYSNSAPVYLKNFVANLIKKLLPHPLVKSNLPSFARVMVTYQKNRKIVYILSYLPERRGEIDIIEEPIELRDVSIKIKTEEEIENVYDAYNMEKFDFSAKNGYAETSIPLVKGYRIIVFEKKEKK